MTKIILAILISILVWRAGVAFGLGQVDCHCPPSVVIELDSEIIEGWLRSGNRICWDLEEK